MTNYEVANQQAALVTQQQAAVLAWQQHQQDTRDTGETVSVERLDSVTKGPTAPTAAAPPAQQATTAPQVMLQPVKASKSKNGGKEKDKTNLKLKIPTQNNSVPGPTSPPPVLTAATTTPPTAPAPAQT